MEKKQINFFQLVKNLFIKYKPELFLVFILILGSFLRLYRISEYMTFLGDEGRDMLVVKRMIVDHKFTLLGPTASVGGFFMGPVYYYFMLPFLWLFRLNPVGPAVMVALFGIVTIYLVYLITANNFSKSAGIFAAGLYALSPLVIAYSRSSWNPNLVPFFSILLIYMLLAFHKKFKNKYILLTGVILGIGIQLHYLFSFLIVLTIVWLIYSFYKLRQIKLNWVIYLIAGILIGDSMFLLFELRHGFPNTRSIINFIRTGQDTGFSIIKFISNISDILYRLFGRLILRLPDIAVFRNLPDYQKIIWTTFTWILAITTTGLTFISLYIRKNLLVEKISINSAHKLPQLKKEISALSLFAMWLIVPLIMFGLYKRDIYDYYLGILYPLPFILTGVFLDKLSKYKFGLLVFIFWFGLIYFNWQGRPFKFEPNRQYSQVEKISRVAFENTDGKPFNFALITDNNSDHAYRYFFEIWGNPPVTIEYPGADPDRRTITNQLIVICETQNCEPLGHPLWEIAGFGRAEIVGQWEVPFVVIYKLIHYQES